MTKPLLNYIRQGSLYQKVSVILGLAGSVSGILLWAVLIFFNPYSIEQTKPGTFYVTFFMLCLPSIIGLFALAFNRLKLIWVVLIWVLPYGLYFSATPGIFNLFGLTLVFYLIAAILASVGKGETKN